MVITIINTTEQTTINSIVKSCPHINTGGSQNNNGRKRYQTEWQNLAHNFISSLWISNQYTTEIMHYAHFADLRSKDEKPPECFCPFC